MTPARKGDGTGLSFNGYSQVRKGDGTVLWNAIPDSELNHLYYAPTTPQADPWEDANADNDLSAVASPTLDEDGINGFASIRYDGSNDYHEGVSLNAGSDVQFTAVAVFESDDSTTEQVIWNNGEDNSTDGYRFRITPAAFSVISNGKDNVDGGSVSSETAYVAVVTYDGSDVIVDVNGDEIINADLLQPDEPTTNFTVAHVPGDGDEFSGYIGAVGHQADFSDAARRNDLTNSFADAFDIDVS